MTKTKYLSSYPLPLSMRKRLVVFLLLGALLMAGCIQERKSSAGDYEEFLRSYLDLLVKGDFDKAANMMLNSSGDPLSGSKKEKWISMVEYAGGVDSYKIIKSEGIDEDAFTSAGAPFKEGKSFTVEISTGGTKTNTTYFVVRYNDKLWIWLDPLTESLLEMAPSP